MTTPETGGPERELGAEFPTARVRGILARATATLGDRLRRTNSRLLPGRLLYGPEWLVLGVNNVCNLRCRMCDVGQAETETNFARNLVGSSPRDMPIELVDRIVVQTERHFPSARLGFAFTEPLIYPHRVEAVGLATARGLSSAVTTNGLTLKSSASELAAAGLDDLFLSQDGPPEIHDEIRGRAGSFDRAVAGVDVLVAADPRPRISVFCVITPWNQGRLISFLEVLSHLPLEQIGFMHPNFTPEAVVRSHNSIYGSSYPAPTSNLGPFDPADMDLPLLEAELAAIESRQWPFPVSFSPNLRGAAALDRFYNRPAELNGRSCGDACRALMVNSSGRVFPAHACCYHVPGGNLHQTTLPEIWNSAELGRFRKTLNRAGGLLPACSRCCSAF